MVMAYSTALALVDCYPVYKPTYDRCRLPVPSSKASNAVMSARCQAFSISEILGLENRVDSTTRPDSTSSISSTDDECWPLQSWTNYANADNYPKGAEFQPSMKTKRRKMRTNFSAYQLHELRRAYAASTYLTFAMEDALTEQLGLTIKQIRTWFQNRRGKQNRQKRSLSNQSSRSDQSSKPNPQKPASATRMATQNRLVLSDSPPTVYGQPRCYPRTYQAAESRWRHCREQSSARLYHSCHGYHPYRRPVNIAQSRGLALSVSALPV